MKKFIFKLLIIFFLSPIANSSEIKKIVEGDLNAKIKIIVYESLTCSHCANFHKDVYPELKNEFVENYEFIENYYSSKVILVHNQNHEIDLKTICKNKYEIGIADPSRAPLGKLSSEILQGNDCSLEEYNTKITSNASSLINKINLKYLNYAIIYESDFHEINKKLDFKSSSNEFQKAINYSFFINKEISSGNKKNILDFIKHLKN